MEIAKTDAAPGSGRPDSLLFTLALLLALGCAAGLWWQARSQPTADAAIAVPTASGAASSPSPDAQAMVARLEARLNEQPEDIEGWQMLGRAYGVMGREQDAVEAYRRALALSPAGGPGRAQAHADLGRAIGKASGRRLTPEADAQLQQALALDPGNVMAHALLGRVALEKGDATGAKIHWEQALAGVDPSHPFAQQLKQSIDLAAQAASAAAPAQ